MKRTEVTSFAKRTLSHEWIVNGKTASSLSKDQQVVVFLHGLLGSEEVRLDHSIRIYNTLNF